VSCSVMQNSRSRAIISPTNALEDEQLAKISRRVLRRKFEACRIKPRFSAFLRVTAEEFEDAKSLWKFFYAHECFKQVENACSFILENSMDENRAGLSRRFVGSANRTFEFEKRGQLFIGTHNQAVSVVAMCVCNPDHSARWHQSLRHSRRSNRLC